jgi:DNA repair photolyase
MGQKVFEEINAKQIMNRVQAPSMPFSWSINPYRGCTHGCSFCYARKTHSFLGMNADDTFQNHILLKSNAAEALETQLAKISKKYKGDPIAIIEHVGLVALGTATDPYQPIEAKAQLTRKCLEILSKYQIPTTITTRSPLILRDIDILKNMNITSINFSVNTLNRKIWRSLEPATPYPMKRLEAVHRLVDNGFHTGIFVAPILPFLTDRTEELDKLFSAAQQHQVQFATPSVLRLAPEVKSWYFQTVSQHYPELISKYIQMYRTGYPTPIYIDALNKRVNFLMSKHGLTAKKSGLEDWRKTWLSHQKWNGSAVKPINDPHLVENTEAAGSEQLSFSF